MLGVAISCGGGGSGAGNSPTSALSPNITSFAAANSPITTGTTTTLTGVFTNGTGVIDQGVGTVTSGTPISISATVDTTYTLTVTNSAGTSLTAKATVNVVTTPTTPVITAPASITASATGMIASVPVQTGCTYGWTITGGTIVAGASTNQIAFAAGTTGSVQLACVATNAAGTASSQGTATCAIVTAPLTPVITAPTNVTAFTSGLIASVPGQAGCTYSWVISGGAITAGVATNQVTFTAGISGLVQLGCVVTNAASTASLQGTADIAIVAAPTPVISSFVANPTTIAGGATATLTGDFTNGTGVITPGNLAATSGVAVSVTPSATTTYTLTVTNLAEVTASQFATVTVTGTGPRTVSGTDLITYLPFNSNTGTITPASPVPAQATPISAVLADGTTTLSGSYNATTGAYSIPNVPAGFYWLHAGTDFIWTSQSAVDLGYKTGGRSNVATDSGSTSLALETSGMDSWLGNDYLMIYDFNSNLAYYPGSPSNGATSLNMTLGWSGLGLIDTTEGDYPRLNQLEASSPGGTEMVWKPTMVCHPSPLTLVNGATNTLSGSFAAIPQTATLTLNYSRSQFAAYRSQYNPNGSYDGPFMEFDWQPGAATYGSMGQWMDGITCQNSNPSVITDLNLGSVPAPSSPAGFEWIAYAGESYEMRYTASGATSPLSMRVRPMRTFSLALPDATHPIKPLLSPVKNPTINGQSLFSDQPGVGLTPTLAWTAPDHGTPQSYIVYVYQLSTQGTSTSSNLISRLYLDGTQTSVTLPSGLLASAGCYVFIVKSYTVSNYDPTSGPHAALPFPCGLSETASNRVWVDAAATPGP